MEVTVRINEGRMEVFSKGVSSAEGAAMLLLDGVKTILLQKKKEDAPVVEIPTNPELVNRLINGKG